MDVVMLGIQVYIGIQVYFFHYLKALETEKPVGLHSSSEFFHSSKILTIPTSPQFLLRLLKSNSLIKLIYCLVNFFNWDSLHARLNSQYEARSYKKKKHKKLKHRYKKSVQKGPTVKRCLLILYLKPLRSQVKVKYSIGREFQSLAVPGKKLLSQASF